MLNKILFSIISLLISLATFSQTINPDDWPELVGLWTFDDAANIEQASVGTNLELFGAQVAVAGPTDTDGATRIGNDSYYKCTHGINPNGGGAYVNEYSLVMDFKVPALGQYYCFYQTNTSNSNDGEVFVNPSGHVGISQTYYTYCTLDTEQWYRLVIAVDLDGSFNYYIDGNLVLEGANQSLDGRFALDSFFYWFADDNDEDNEFDIAAVGIFDTVLSSEEVTTLGGYGHVFPAIPIAGTDPYLQSPTPTSIYVSWHSDDTSGSVVDYGTTPDLGQQAIATFQDISGKTWHTAKLEGLTPDTVYYYQCSSGEDVSDITFFRTLSLPDATDQHVRFLLLGDSRTDVYRTSIISQTAEQQLIDIYGENWHNEVDFVMHVGDVAQTDAIQNYTNEFFTPYANLSKKVPFMISVGNHEYNGGAQNYFKYVKYEELTGAPYDLPSDFNEKFYRFQVGNCMFIGLNSNWVMSVVEQLEWLEIILDEAEEDDSIDFIFPFAHHPGHSEIWPDGNTNFVQDDLLGLFKNYSKISMYSYGHSHGYERGVLALDQTNPNYQHDAHLLLSGGAGSALDRWGMYDNQEDYPEIHMTLDHYVYSIVDVDIDQKSWNIKTFSLGHADKPLENVLIDEWYYNQNDAKPETPTAISIAEQGTSNAVLIASDFEGVDELMSSQFQLVETSGDFSNPILDVTRDWHNLYGDSGAPDYFPTDVNDGIDLTSLNVSDAILDESSYSWRVRYRDFNLKWSNWSEESAINVLSNNELLDARFDVLIAPNPTENEIGVRYQLNNEEEVEVCLYDTTGRLMHVISESHLQSVGAHELKWDASQLEQGLYFVVFDFSGKKVSKRVLLK